MMTPLHRLHISRPLLPALALLLLALPSIQAQTAPPPAQQPSGQAPSQTQPTDNAGPDQDNGPIILRKKKEAPESPPPAPAEPRPKNPNNDTYSLRVDVPIVNLDVSVILDKTHQFVPGLKANNFLVLEDGAEQEVTSLHVAQAPITAVMLLEFASNSYYFIYDMQNASVSFFRQLRPDDYIAVMTYDLKTHIVNDFTRNKEIVGQSLQSLIIPGFSDTNLFDALYETLDRTSRIEGRKYVILIGTGRDTFSKLTLDKILAKIKGTPNVTIFTISTGNFLAEMADARGMMGGPSRLNYLQAQNQLHTFAKMTGGLSFDPMFQGALPDIFAQINNSIRNQYILTYRPTNPATDGAYRKIKVLLVDNEGHPLKMQDEKGKPLKYSIIARDGYYAKRPVE